MIIKTKYNPGQIIYYIQDNEIRFSPIRDIKVIVDNTHVTVPVIKILYQIAFGYEDKNWIDEKKAFLSVSAVKKSISIIKK